MACHTRHGLNAHAPACFRFFALLVLVFFPIQAAEHARYVFQEQEQVPVAESRSGQQANSNSNRACTLCLVKPHVVRDGRLGAVLSFVTQRGFEVNEQGPTCLLGPCLMFACLDVSKLEIGLLAKELAPS